MVRLRKHDAANRHARRFALLWVASVNILFASARSPDSVVIPAGVYRPFYRSSADPEFVAVASFQLDTLPITNGEFLAFVTTHPQWRRSHISPLFADQTYLQHWESDLTLGPRAPADAPVVHVSWFAARAYARHLNRRLPTTAEWETAAAAGYRTPFGRSETDFNRDLYDWLARPTPTVLPAATSANANLYGVRGMHGLVWEWVDDFNTAMITGESRSDSSIDQNQFCGGAAALSSDTSDYAAFMRQALRSSLTAKQSTSSLGFRCAADLPAESPRSPPP